MHGACLIYLLNAVILQADAFAEHFPEHAGLQRGHKAV